MGSINTLSPEILQRLICPVTKAKVEKKGDTLVCVDNPVIKYPIVDGIPILIDDENSLFSTEDYINRKNTTYRLHKNKIKEIITHLIPSISLNLKTRGNCQEIIALLPGHSKVLVVGGRIIGKGMDALYSSASYEIIGLDVSFGPNTGIISDAHNIPFENDTFDAVIVQAVLEHVLNPSRCVSEIYRVLKNSGIIYAETPFMQQVHGKQYDYTRFSHLGHRWLLRRFEEIKSGPSGGPGMALAYSYKYFMRSFVTSSILRGILVAFAHLTSFYLKYFDYYLNDKPGSYDAAAGYYFLGKKTNKNLSEKELIKQFRGLD